MLFARLPQLRTLDPGIRGPRPHFSVSLSDSLADEDGAEGRDGSHEKGDATFQGLPEDLPYHVDATRIRNSGYAYDGEYGHHGGKAEEEAQGKLLSFLDFGSSEDDQGDADDFFF